MNYWDYLEERVPASVLAALPSTREPTILVLEGKLVGCNQAWQQLCGHDARALGASPKILQGEWTDTSKARRFSAELARCGHASSTLVNYTRAGRAFVHLIKGWALSVPNDPSGRRFFLAKGCEVHGSVRSSVLAHARAAAAAREERAWTLVSIVAALASMGAVSVASLEDELGHKRSLVLPFCTSPEVLLCAGVLLVSSLFAATHVLEKLRLILRICIERLACGSSECAAVPVSFALAVVGLALVSVPSFPLLLIAIPASTTLLSALVFASIREAEGAEVSTLPPVWLSRFFWAVPPPAAQPDSQADAWAVTGLLRSSHLLHIFSMTAAGVVMASLAQSSLVPGGVHGTTPSRSCIPTLLSRVCFDTNALRNPESFGEGYDFLKVLAMPPYDEMWQLMG
mmetsp:Transcript_9238/g.21449  ORF Transcript_9238/g.21449 Transcript_9238/m.21449 type:complete len:400 (-) Transcript_9238:757-1956(-)